jgi:hypothetical protein
MMNQNRAGETRVDSDGADYLLVLPLDERAVSLLTWAAAEYGETLGVFIHRAIWEKAKRAFSTEHEVDGKDTA